MNRKRASGRRYQVPAPPLAPAVTIFRISIMVTPPSIEVSSVRNISRTEATSAIAALRSLSYLTPLRRLLVAFFSICCLERLEWPVL